MLYLQLFNFFAGAGLSLEVTLNTKCNTFKVTNTRPDQALALNNRVDKITNIHFITIFLIRLIPNFLRNIPIILMKPIILSKSI